MIHLPYTVDIGLQIEVDRLEYYRIELPHDIRDATFVEAGVYLPAELKARFPDWCLMNLLPGSIFFAPGTKVPHSSLLIKTAVFLTSTSVSGQNWTVLSDWNSSENLIQLISHSGIGGDSSHTATPGGGGGGAGYADVANDAMTPGSSVEFFIRETGATGNNDGTATRFHGTTLANSSVGIRGGESVGGISPTAANGANITNSVGDHKYAGGKGGNGSTTFGTAGGGGGAAGPHGAGGAGQVGQSAGRAGIGGTGDNGNTAPSGNNGTQFDSTHGSGSGGCWDVGTGVGGNYGGGGCGASGQDHSGRAGTGGMICITNNNLH